MYYFLGLLFLALAKAQHMLRGYCSPKPITDIEGCVQYAIKIAARSESIVKKAGGSVVGKRILELGPGSDLGVGLLLIQAGAAFYCGIDRNPLAINAPRNFYDRLCELTGVADTLSTNQFRYIVDSDFNLTKASRHGPYDLIMSNAAFEHFDNVPKVMRDVAKCAASDALFVSEIDLQTHSRWIRECDPNNIYRYPDWLYRLFYFPGQPNRLRPPDYIHALAQAGWTDINTIPSNRFNSTGRTVNWKFADPFLDWLSFTVTAHRRIK